MSNTAVPSSLVLVIDDDQRRGEALRNRVAQFGYQVNRLNDLSASISFVALLDVPVVILAYVDPEEGQSDVVCEVLRNIETAAQTYIIGYSESLELEKHERFLASGGDAVIAHHSSEILLKRYIETGFRQLHCYVALSEQNSEALHSQTELVRGLDQLRAAVVRENLVTGEQEWLSGQRSVKDTFPLSPADRSQLITGDYEGIRAALNRLNEPVEFEIEAIDGTRGWVVQTTLAIEYSGKQPAMRTSLVRSIPNRSARESRESSRSSSLEDLISRAGIGTFEYRLNDTNITLDRSARRLFFLDFGSSKGNLCISQSVIYENLETESAAAFQAILSGLLGVDSGFGQEVKLVSLKGYVRHVLVSLHRSDTQSDVVSGTLVDLTHRYAVELDRAEDISERRDLIAELEAQNQERDRLFAIISHEVRTPLASLSMLAVDQNIAENLPQGKQMQTLIEQSLQLLNELRAVVHPKEERLLSAQTDISLKDVVDSAVAAVNPLITSANFTLNVDLIAECNKIYKINESSLRRVLINLVKNAVVHSGGNHVDLDITLVSESAQQTVFFISILDNGHGIDAATKKVMFKPFRRGESSVDGSGLGLMIVKGLVEDMNGSIYHIPVPSGGTRFLIELPLELAVDDPSDSIAKLSGQSFEPLEEARVLFAEDNPTLRHLSAAILQSLDPEVLVVAEDGARALAAFNEAENAFNIVITDIYMPHMSGYDLTEQLRKSGYEGPIIGLTAATLGSETERLLELGANIVLEKPISKPKLIELWRSLGLVPPQ